MSHFITNILKDPRFTYPTCSMKTEISQTDWENKLEDMVANPDKYHDSILKRWLTSVPKEKRDTFIAFSENGTPVCNEGGHPHFTNHIAIIAISKMNIPAVPANPQDSSQTRICETYDFGFTIGCNHRVKKNSRDITFLMDRGIDEPRGYKSWMVLRPCEKETKLTTVVVWYDEHWVLFTNHEGEEDLYPAPGTKRYEHLDPIERGYAAYWHYQNPLSPTYAELSKAISELKAEIDLEKSMSFVYRDFIPPMYYKRICDKKALLNKMIDFLRENQMNM